MPRLTPVLAVALLFPDLALATRVPVLEGQCDLTPAGVTSAEGITYNPAAGFAVLSGTTVVFVDASCNVTHPSFSTSAFSTNPLGIAWASDLGEYAFADRSANELYFANDTGQTTGHCDLATAGVSQPSGVTRDVAHGVFVVTDSQQGRAVVVDDSNRVGGTCHVVTTLGVNAGCVDVTMAPNGDVAFVRESQVRMMDATQRFVDSFDLNRTPGYDDALVWDPAADDRVLVANGHTLFRLDIRGTIETACTFPGITAMGVSAGPAPEQLLIADDQGHNVMLVSTRTCTQIGAVGVQAAGVGNMADAAWDAATGEIVVADPQHNALFFLDGTTGALHSRCDLDGTTVDVPTGVDVIPELDLIAVTSATTGAWALLDRSCAIVHSRSASALEDKSDRLRDPTDVAWLPATGHFVVGGTNTLGLVDVEGAQRAFFTAEGYGSGASGIAPDAADPLGLYLMNGGTLAHAVLPFLAENPGASGRFTSPTATVYLWDRGDGRVTGTALVGGDTLPLFGQLSGAGGSLIIGTETGAGQPLVVQVSVSADFSTLTAPPPIGVLRRG
ncbi:MAG: hypothetical protein H6738_07780 [Alphaproteobacteria bacterium]|nr:hypothetical protein [Alphaproteobacteria bacterium]MCB9696665.1 hypothetical protein [Alphaproteobacteria bacterium]